MGEIQEKKDLGRALSTGRKISCRGKERMPKGVLFRSHDVQLKWATILGWTVSILLVYGIP